MRAHGQGLRSLRFRAFGVWGWRVSGFRVYWGFGVHAQGHSKKVFHVRTPPEP